MNVLEKLTSHKGAAIEIHFEDESNKESILEGHSKKSLQEKLRGMIDGDGVDTGKGTVIHALVNTQGICKPMTETQYAEWQAQEKKDWFHKNRRRRSLAQELDLLISLAAISELLGSGRRRGFGLGRMPIGAMMMGGFPGFDENEFVGPTDEELEEILSSKNPEDIDRILVISEKDEGIDCSLCLAPTGLCPGRHASYGHEEMKKAVEALLKSSASPE